MNKNTLSSDQTKDKLINEGIKLFALYGINGVKTRELSDQAGVNQSAIPYHLGGKLGVYSAAIEKVTQELAKKSNTQQIERSLSQLSTQKKHSDEDIRTLLSLLMNGLTTALFLPEHKYYSMLILREQLEPTDNYDIIYKGFIEPFHIHLTKLILLVKHVNEQQAVIIAHAIIGQVLGFVIAQKPFLKRLNKTTLDPILREEITQQLNQLAFNLIKN